MRRSGAGIAVRRISGSGECTSEPVSCSRQLENGQQLQDAGAINSW
jgi:hypothetical protein